MSKITEKKLIQCVCKDAVYGADELVLECNVCKRWLHAECLGLDKYDLPDLNTFVCVFCGTAILVVNSETNSCIQNVPLLDVDNDHVVCCCDEQNESGFMLQCERCGTWQHGRCMKLEDGQSPDNYHCHICRYAKSEKSQEPEQNIVDGKKETKKEKSIKIVEISCENVYVCKICGQEFDNGQALIYHKTYEKCSQNESEEITNSQQDMDKVSNNLNGSNNRDIGEIIDNSNKQTKTADKPHRRKSKSHQEAQGKSSTDFSDTIKNKSKHPTDSKTQSKLGNEKASKTAVISSPPKTNSSTTSITNTRTNDTIQRPTSSTDNTTTQSNIYDTQSTIHDVHVTKLKSTTDISQNTTKDTTFACGGCSLAFADKLSLETHHLNTLNCGKSSKIIRKATVSRLSPEEANSQNVEIDESIRCICNSKIDKGVMIQCDLCQTWQHTACIGLKKKQTLPTNYCCFDCVNKGCFSVILDMCKKHDISIENISENFKKDGIVNVSRKRKLSESPTVEISETKKHQKESNTRIEDEIISSPEYVNIESDEEYLTASSSQDDRTSKKNTPKKIQVQATVRKKGKAKQNKKSLVRCSRAEIDAIQEYFSNLLTDEQLFTHLQPNIQNFKQTPYSQVLKILPAQLNFPKLEITSNFNESTYTNSLKFLSSLLYPYANQLLINTGGPVNSLAWVPAVLHKSQFTDNIYLSITTQPNFDTNDQLFVAKDDVIETESQDIDVVQIWGICVSKHLETNASLDLGIILKQGKVMAMQWCPSGCLDDVITIEPTSLPRLGLLLVALNTGKLGIIAIPQPNSLQKKDTDNNPWFDNQFYEVEHFDIILQLAADVSKPRNKCLCCDWSLHPGHNLIVAGFQNGCVGVWNLNARIFCDKHGPIPIYSPIMHIMAHQTAVISVAWSPQDVFLFATASHDVTSALIWDTRQPNTHVADLNTFQVCITWAMCWPISYLRPICGLEVFPKQIESSWYGNLFSHTYRSVLTKNSTNLALNYQQCPTICSISWSMLDCALLLGSFSGELIFLNSFFHARKSTDIMQPQKILDISFKTKQDLNELLIHPFDPKKLTSVVLDFDYSCFANCTHAEFKSSDVMQESLIKRLLKQDGESKPASQQTTPKIFKAECENCHKKFAIQKSLNYHIEHNVCKGGTVHDNRGNFFKPTGPPPPPQTESTIKSLNLEADKLMLQDLKDQMNDPKTPEKNSEKISKPKSNKKSIRNPKIIHDCGEQRGQSMRCEKPRNSYVECTQSKIKQVRWFPNAPYQNVFAVGTGLGIITISAIPEP
ncbi:hypothetical protein LOD99_7272 [Oopsacas minuta]|uniref:Zinc finger PHD-type domain-containing protein n=1 Tax=Oopsacas minuta TaxID=111878 RepID=A0AAV7JW48_9METZ|nr:hypothetical protein LOD99_7272 [Oopsacas minuta]